MVMLDLHVVLDIMCHNIIYIYFSLQVRTVNVFSLAGAVMISVTVYARSMHT